MVASEQHAFFSFRGGKLHTLIDSGAEFSEPDRIYRYRLWRRWAHGPMLLVVGLNPSTADEQHDDPTIRRCLHFAEDWGYAGLRMLNIFAYRATNPKIMRAHYKQLYREDRPAYLAEYQENYQHIVSEARGTIREGGAVLAAWGNRGRLLGQGDCIRRALADQGPLKHGPRPPDRGVACFGLTSTGDPIHPLYQPTYAEPVPFLGDGGRLVTDPPAPE